MLTVNEILTNKKKVSFSYGEDTVTILYNPFIAKKKLRYKWVQWLARQVDKGRLKTRMLHLAFLRTSIYAMTYTMNGEEVEIPTSRLQMFDNLFLHKLYNAMTREIISTTKERIGEELKKN